LRPPPELIAFVPEQPYVPPGTLRELLVPAGRDGDLTNDAILAVLHEVGLGPAITKHDGFEAPRNWHDVLSLGDQQLMAVARVIISGARYVFLDRLNSALTDDARRRVLRLLTEHGITYVMIAHDLGTVRYLSQKVAAMYAGRFVETGSCDTIFDAPMHPYTIALISAVGTDVLRQFFPAFVVLLFLIPPPISVFEPLLQPFQVATADVVETVYAAFNIQVELIGPYVRIDDTQVPMSDVFSVLGVLFAFILIGYTVAFGAPLRISARVIILLASVLAGFLVNVCRALATAWLYTIYSPERVGQIMTVAGWVILGVGFLVLLGVVWGLAGAAAINEKRRAGQRPRGASWSSPCRIRAVDRALAPVAAFVV